MAKSLHYINKVEMIESSQLTNSIFIPGVGVYLSSGLTFDKLCTTGLSSMEISDQIENKIRSYTQKLTSVLFRSFEVANHKYCFLVTSVSGEQFLLGSKERPFPLVTFTDTRPEGATSKCAVTMLVNYTNATIYKVLGI